MAYTLEQLQKMGATPVNSSPPSTPSAKSYTFDDLQKMGAVPLDSSSAKPSPASTSSLAGVKQVFDEPGILNTGSKLFSSTGKFVGGALLNATNAVAANTGDVQAMNQSNQNLNDIDMQAVQKARALAASGNKDAATRLLNVVRSHGSNITLNDILSDSQQNNAEQIAGAGLGTAAELGSLATGGGGASVAEEALPTAKTSFGRSVFNGIKGGAKVGAAYGAAQGTGSAMQNNGSLGDIALNAAAGALGGGVTGGAFGGLTNAAISTPGVAKNVFGAISDIKGNMAAKNAESLAAKEFATAQIPEAQKVLNHGLDPSDLKLIQDASPEDRSALLKMIDTKQASLENPRSFAQPNQLAGEEFLNQAKHLASVQKDAGTKLGQIVSSMPDEVQDITPITNSFLDELETQHNIHLHDDGTLDFSNSDMAGAHQSGDRSMINSVWERLQPNEEGFAGMTPQDMHAMRQSIFHDVGAGNGQKVIGISEIPAMNVRQALGDALDTLSPDYKETNLQFAKSTSALNDFQKAMGKNWDFRPDSIKSLRAGEVANRILGNASARPLDVLQNLGDTARAFGYQSNSDPFTRVLFSDMLDDVMGTPKTRSLQGQVTRGIQQAQQNGGAMKDIATADGVTGKLMKAGEKIYQHYAETPQSVKVQAMKNLINKLGTN